MENKKQTAITNLKQDLIETINKSNIELDNIVDEKERFIAKSVFNKTINRIIERIDEELLEMEKEQIIDAYLSGYSASENLGDSEQYYKETYEDE